MNLSDMWQTWLKATTNPNEATYEELRHRPDANITTAIIYMAIYGVVAAVVSVLSSLLFAGAMSAWMPNMMQQMNLPPAETAQAEQLMRLLMGGGMLGMAGFAGLINIVTVPLFFLIGVGIYYLIAKVLGGVGDFGRYAYLNAAFSAPLGILTALLNIVPLAGCITPFISIYSLVLLYFATKTEHQLNSGRAIWVVLIPVLVVLALMLCVIFGAIGLIMSLQSQ
ncbi:MAG: Yip1 family protein [Caldilinea sp.]